MGMIEGIFQTENYILGKKLLDVSEVQHQLISGNISNIETPGYKRMEVEPSFEKDLINSVYNGDFDKVRKSEIRVGKDTRTKSLREDGNNVEMDKELMHLNQNSMEYEFLTQYVSNDIKALNKAIRGTLS
jgi:flagellar basal-body rod protein FlgB